MTFSPRVTVTIPFYNKTSMLLKAVESVRAQSYPHWKLIICDDAGPEPECAIEIEELGDSRIQYFRNSQNLGLAGNWNLCVEKAADTEFVVILHSDDELAPNYLTEMLKFADEHPEGSLYFCQPTIIDAESREIFSFVDRYKEVLIPRSQGITRLNGDEGVSALMKGNFICCPSVLYRKQSLPEGALFRSELRCVPDWELSIRILLRGGSILGIQKNLFRYRRHGTSVTDETRINLRMFHEELALRKETASQTAERGWSNAYRSASQIRGIILALGFFLLKDLSSLRIGPAIAKFRLGLKILIGQA